MKILIGTIIVGTSKLYAVPKFQEMCHALFPDLHVAVVVDQPGRTTLPEVVDERLVGAFWATEIVYRAKMEVLRDLVLEFDYDAVVWQGIDCYYRSRADFDLLVDGLERHAVVGGLVAGRDLENYPVCREFVPDGNGSYSTRQVELEPWQLEPEMELVAIPGYIGSDATIIRRDALEQVSMDGYVPWETREDRDENGAIGPEEFWMWSAITRNDIWPAVETRCRPFHAHETLRTVRFRGEVCLLDEIKWP